MNTVYASLAKKLPSWIYKPLAQVYIDYNYPRHLFIETTANCNLKCEYCPREKIKESMEIELFKDIIREATKYGSRSFSLHLFGEPLLYPKWYEAIKFIKEKNKHHTVLFTTNGTLIERSSNLNKLIHSGVDQVLWSWRPEVKFKEETKKKLRKWGKFRVRIIKELTPEEGLLEWKNWPNKELRNLHNYGGNVDLQSMNLNMPSSLIAGQAQPLSYLNQKRWPCYHLWFAPAVAWNGSILICCADPHHKEVLGKFPAQSVGEVWRGRQLNSIRQSHLEGKYNGICKNCDVWKQYPSIF